MVPYYLQSIEIVTHFMNVPFGHVVGRFPPHLLRGVLLIYESRLHIYDEQTITEFLIKTLSKLGLAAHLDNPFA